MSKCVPLIFREAVTWERLQIEKIRKDVHFHASEKEGDCPLCL